MILPVVYCYATDRNGYSFSAYGYNSVVVQNAALSSCWASSTGCYAQGCRY